MRFNIWQLSRATSLKAHATTIMLDLNSSTIQSQILSVVSTWERNKLTDEKHYEIEHELEAVRRLFSQNIDKNFIGIGIRYLDALIGFIILEMLPRNHSIGHFWKCDTRFGGIYQFLKQESARLLMERGVQFLNFEQDLGIPNLRQAQMNFRPSSFLKKYRVELNV